MKNKGRLTKFAFIGLVFCILVLLIVIGCGGTTPPTTSTPITTKSEGPVTGGTLKIGTLSDVVSLGYPAIYSNLTEYRLNFVCFESLGRIDNTGKIQPWLALDFKEDPIAKTITLPLRKGVKFHDGTDFNAEAAKWNIELMREAKRVEVVNIASIDVVDDYTVRVNLSKWDNTAAFNLGWYAKMISPTAFKANGGKDWAIKNPVGTGPFQFVSWQRDVKQVYKKFPGYWQQGKPYLDGIEIIVIADPGIATVAFKGKEVDALIAILPQDAKGIETAGSAIIANNSSGVGCMSLGVITDSGHANSPFANVLVRKAVAHAIDNKAICDSILYGYALPTNQWGLPGTWAYNPNVKGYPYDPTKAKQLLAEAGYPNGFSTKMPFRNMGDLPKIMTAIQGFLKVVGINAELDAMDAARAMVAQTKGWEGIIQWGGKSDIDPNIQKHLSKTGFLYAPAVAHYDKLEKLMADATGAQTFEEKVKIYQQIQSVFIDEYALIQPIYVYADLVAKYPYIQSDGFNKTDNTSWTPESAWIKK